MEFFEESNIGFSTSAGKVPIVVGLSLFDLGNGSAMVRPGHKRGKRSCSSSIFKMQLGRVGAGWGATVSKWRGKEFSELGGLGCSTLREGDLIVSCLIAVNASGDFVFGKYPDKIRDGQFSIPKVNPFENTTIGVVATNAKLTKSECFPARQSAHDGYARALFPAHTSGDGDAVVGFSNGQVPAEMSQFDR
ncbi:MAG: hypothetical protein Ct9H90mP30_4700 [Actinomycetota bacterium]|nr:MAG: hypothetical protein Ct9H90mP30_4700 [Actinomycetota bacterium]